MCSSRPTPTHQDQGSGRRPGRSCRPVHGHGPHREPGRSARHHTIEPTFGLPATWVDAALKEEASLKGYTVVDASTVLSTHLTELLKANCRTCCPTPRCRSCSRTCRRPANWSRTSCRRRSPFPASSAFCSAAGRAGIDPRSATILEGIADALAFSRNPADHGRARPRPAGAADLRAEPTHNGYLPLIALSAQMGADFAESIIGPGEDAASPCSRRSCRSS